MRKIKPAGPGERIAIAEAVSALRDARTLLRSAGADRACKAAARALDNTEGAIQNTACVLRGVHRCYVLNVEACAMGELEESWQTSSAPHC